MSKLSKSNIALVEVRPYAGMSQVNPKAAGVDIGAHEQLVRAFGLRRYPANSKPRQCRPCPPI